MTTATTEIFEMLRKSVRLGPHSEEVYAAVEFAIEAGWTKEDMVEPIREGLGSLFRHCTQRCIDEAWAQATDPQKRHEHETDLMIHEIHQRRKETRRSAGTTPKTDGRRVLVGAGSARVGSEISGRRVQDLGPVFRLSDSDPSIHGSQWLGHEGERVQYAYLGERTS